MSSLWDVVTTPGAVAGGLVNVPSGNISAITVQAAINELDAEKASLAQADLSGNTHAATSKTTPVDADEFAISDSAGAFGLKKLTWANLKAAMAAYYNTLTATLTNKTLTEPILGGNTTHTATSDVATLGTELTTNGTFTGSATDWTLGTNWAYGTDNVILTLSVAVEGTLSQNISVTSGESYLVEWSQTNSIANNGTIRPSIGSVNGLYVCPTSIASATMSQVVVAAASGTVALIFTPTDITSTGTITIDTVTVKQITPITATLTLKDTTGAIQYEDRVAHVTNNGNTLNGLNAGKFIITGHSNSFNGSSAGYSNTIGYGNTFIGFQPGYSNTTGNFNNFSGFQSGYSNTTGGNNNFSGYQSGYSNTTGNFNNFSGYQSGYSNTIGISNNFSGYQSGYSNTTGGNNNFSGRGAGYSNTTGVSNNFMGYGSGYSNTTGTNNNFFGHQSGYFTTTGGNNSLVGYRAGYNNTTGSNNTADGLSSLNDLAPTAKAITAFADYSGTVVGTVKATCVGHGRTTADSLIVSGTVNYNGTYSVTVIDVDNFYFTKTFVATEAGWWTLSGFLASNNTAIGYNTGRGITTGSGNTILGANVTGLSANLTNNIIIANSAGTIKAQHDSTNWTFTGGASITGDLVLSKTVTAAGTTGAQTINKTSGSVNFAAAATSLVVTNSLVSTTSIIQCTVSTNDTTMKSVAIVAVAGSFTIYANAAATAETRVNFTVTN